MAVPVRQNGTTLTGANGTSAVVTLPASIAAGDVVVVYLYKENTNAVTPPAGFTEKTGTGVPATTTAPQGHYVFWKRMSGGESGTVTFSWTGSVFRAAAAERYSGCVASGDPIELIAGASNNASVTTLNVSLTGTSADTLLVWSGTNFAGGNTWTPPTGYTERADIDVISDADKDNAAGGNTGNVTGTANVSGAMTAILLSLASGGATASPPPVQSARPGRTWERRFKHRQSLPLPPPDVVTGTAEGGSAYSATTATGNGIKVAIQGAVCSAATAPSGNASKSTAVRGQIYGAGSGLASGKKVAPKAAQAYGASTAQASGKKVAPAATQTYAAGTAQSGPRKGAVGSGTVFGAGFAYRSAAVAPRAQGGFCGAAGSTSGRAAHVAVRTGPASAAGTTQGRSTKKAVQGGTSAAAGSCQGAVRKITRGVGHCSAAVAAQAAGRKLVLQAGRSYAAGYTQAERRALSCTTPRPDSGTTTRPSIGSTARPNTGITARTSAGVTARPDTGITERPCIKT